MTISNFYPFTLISVLKPLVMFVISLVFSALILMLYVVEDLPKRSTNFASKAETGVCFASEADSAFMGAYMRPSPASRSIFLQYTRETLALFTGDAVKEN